jgi:hypothetical protein
MHSQNISASQPLVLRKMCSDFDILIGQRSHLIDVEAQVGSFYCQNFYGQPKLERVCVYNQFMIPNGNSQALTRDLDRWNHAIYNSQT